MLARFLNQAPLVLLGFLFLHIECQQLTKDEINQFFESAEKKVSDLFTKALNDESTSGPRPHSGNKPAKPNVFKPSSSPNILVENDSPAAIRGKFSQAQPEAINQANKALMFENVALDFIHSMNIPPEKISTVLNSQDLIGSKLASLCVISEMEHFNPSRVEGHVPNCVKNKYRTINGTCNNPVQQEWGKSFKRFLRFIPVPAYEDGVSAPRTKSINGSNLPSARTVSRNVILNKPDGKESDENHPAWSHFFALFGQFLDHDITNTPQFTASDDGRPPKCCNVDVPHQECFQIDTSDDPLFQKFNKNCMEFVRSLPAQDPICKLGIREQQNQVTAFIDGSQVYGSTDEEAKRLKDPSTGKLKFTVLSGGNLVKNKNEVPAEECLKKKDDKCDFEAGDVRVNMVPSLVSMHTLWLRQHNRLVDLLKENGWTKPEELYQEARRIVGAQLQHITYNEFLPVVFLKSPNKFPDVKLDKPVPYDIIGHPGIKNEFATAAFRFGHSMIKGIFTLADGLFKTVEPNPNNVSNHYFFPYDVYESDKLDQYLRGHTIDHSQKTNNIITDQLTNFLFKKPGVNEPALDLASLNIQRGRDHGLPSYMEYRKKCGLAVQTEFQELNSIMLPSCSKLLQETYNDVQDIDLWVGGLCEDPESTGAVGPVFACIIGEQFSRLRKNDRFFYDHIMPPMTGLRSSFTKEQVAEIKKITLAKVICWNSNFKNIREKAMLTVDQPKDCADLKKNDMDIKMFKKGKDESLLTPPLQLMQMINAFRNKMVPSNDELNEPEKDDITDTTTLSYVETSDPIYQQGEEE